jgi:uracil-DNA glycosylase family 4
MQLIAFSFIFRSILMTLTRAQKLKALYERNEMCSPCSFGQQDPKHKVFGEGNPFARIMLIGEAPGAEEDRLKRPFVGRSGKLLTVLLEKAGMLRADVFITNIIKCRPPNNRTPLPSEITPEVKQLLKEEISLIKPRVICTLGSVATQLFIQQPVAMSRVRGKPIEFPGLNLAVIPTYHPAYVLRNPAAADLLEHDLKTAITLAEKEK